MCCGDGKEGGGLVGRPLGHKDFREAPRQPGHLPNMGHWQCSKGDRMCCGDGKEGGGLVGQPLTSVRLPDNQAIWSLTV